MNESVADWYAKSQALADAISRASCWRINRPNNSFSVTADPPSEDIKRWIREAEEAVDAWADDILSQANSIKEQAITLGERYAEVKNHLEFAYAELRDFETPGFSEARFAWPVLWGLAWKVSEWGREIAAARRSARSIVFQTWDERERYLRNVIAAIEARLLLEHSQIQRDIANHHPPLVLSKTKEETPTEPPPNDIGRRPAETSFDFRKWYDEAHDLVLIIRRAKHWRHRGHNLGNSISVTDDPTPEQIKQRVREANAKADAAVDAIFRDMELIEQSRDKLREGIESLWPLLEVGYFDLRDFNAEGLPGGRCVWVAIDNLAERVQRWGNGIAYARQIGRTLNCKELEELREREAWLEPTIDAIRARLTLEKSWLLKNTRHPLVISNSNATPTEEATATATTKTKAKKMVAGRSRGKGELTPKQELLAAAIEDWHGFELETMSCTNCQKISYKELAVRTKGSKGETITKFFERWFPHGGNAAYKRLCELDDPTALAAAIAKLSHEGALAVVSLSESLATDRKTKRPGDDIED